MRVLRKNGRIVVRNGRRARENCRTPCCQPATCLWYRFARCGNPQCPPENAPAALWRCRSVPPPQGATFEHGNFLCYRWDGAVGVPVLPPGSEQAENPPYGADCASPECNRNFCQNFFGMSPCNGETAVGCIVVMSAGMYQQGTRVGIAVCPGTTERSCYCLNGLTYDVLPPGATIVFTDDAVTNNNCCKCRYNLDRSRGVSRPDCAWGPNPNGDINGCCCGRFIDMSLNFQGIGPFGTLGISNRRNCGPVAPNAYACTWSFSEGGTPRGSLRIVFFCGGLIQAQPVLGEALPPAYITQIFTPNTPNRSCTSWASSPFITSGSASISMTTDSGACNCAGGGSSPVRFPPADPRMAAAFAAQVQRLGCAGCGG